MAQLYSLRSTTARWVLVRSGSKRPAWRRWQRLYPTDRQVADHLDTGGVVGIEPASLGLVALDQDFGDSTALLADYPPLLSSDTPNGQHHFYFKQQGMYYPNGDWRYGGAGGQIRCRGGFVIVYSERPFFEVERLKALYESGLDAPAPPIELLRPGPHKPPPPPPLPPLPPIDPGDIHHDEHRNTLAAWYLDRRPLYPARIRSRHPWILQTMRRASAIGGNIHKRFTDYVALAFALGSICHPPMDTRPGTDEATELTRIAEWVYDHRLTWVVTDEVGGVRFHHMTEDDIAERNRRRRVRGGQRSGETRGRRADERAHIAQVLQQQDRLGVSEIARRMGVDRRTVTRLLKRAPADAAQDTLWV